MSGNNTIKGPESLLPPGFFVLFRPYKGAGFWLQLASREFPCGGTPAPTALYPYDGASQGMEWVGQNNVISYTNPQQAYIGAGLRLGLGQRKLALRIREL